jgi:hypothetical protein
LIDNAFETTHVSKTRKTERFLTSMTPLLKKLSTKEITAKFVDLIKTFKIQPAAVAAV